MTASPMLVEFGAAAIRFNRLRRRKTLRDLVTNVRSGQLRLTPPHEEVGFDRFVDASVMGSHGGYRASVARWEQKTPILGST